jgi:hypothetical protein
MPIYFGPQAPTCPTSKDQILPGMPGVDLPWLGPVSDLQSALIAVNRLSQYINQLYSWPVINNVFNYKTPNAVGAVNPQYKLTYSRWAEDRTKRVRRRYKYYAKDQAGNIDMETFVITERIEQMAWYDRGWKSWLIWRYGDKGEGEPVS